MRRIRVIICKIIISLLAVVSLVGFCSFSGQNVYAASEELETLEVHYLDVGQGDCTLIKCGDEAMLIDAGDETKGYDIADYLINHGVRKLKYFVLTHADADHCGGADTVMYMLDECDLVIKDNSSKDTVAYREVNDMIKYLGIKTEKPVYGAKYQLGGATFTLIGQPLYGEEENNDSIALIVDYAKTSFLFTGDAMEEEEKAILDAKTDVDCDVLKIGHHGSKNSTSEKFLKEVSPTYAVISCGENNKYGHPHADTLNKLRGAGIKTFRTDEQGTIVATSDGKKITWNCPPSASWLTGTAISNGASFDGTVMPQTTTASYVANTNTKKFHYPTCKSVSEMKEKNKKYFEGDRQELIDEGYRPCKNCNP